MARRGQKLKIDEEYVRKLWNQGCSRTVIATRLGVGPSSVTRVLCRLGLSSNKEHRHAPLIGSGGGSGNLAGTLSRRT